MQINPNHPLRQLFAAQIEHAFCTEVGLCDPMLTDYLADLLTNFTHIDRLNAVKNAQGKKLEQMAAMLSVMSEDKPTSMSERDRQVYKQIGDYTLFWAGLFPEHLRQQRPKRTDILVEYVSQGKRSYAIVSELVDESSEPPASLFRHLSDDFEYCLYGLGLVRRGFDSVLKHHDQDDTDLIQ